MASATAPVPARVRVAMAHAVLQRTAELEGLDLLHIKGMAVDPALGRVRGGADADVLVRPAHVDRLLAALRARGWRQQSTFESDSDFGSAVTLRHSHWEFADVHRFFPGIGAPPDRAFDRLWRDRTEREIAGVACAVPDLVGQSFLLLLNAARTASPQLREADVTPLWRRAPEDRRRAVVAMVEELQAQVAFAAATGDLERFRGARDYDLWRIESGGGTRIERWVARVRAAPTARDAVRVAARAPLVNVDHLESLLGRPPTRAEVVREFFARPGRGLAEELRALRARRDLRR